MANIVSEIGNKDDGFHLDNIHFFKGICEDKIVYKSSGNKGFGYDPIFQPDGASKTFAEMETDEKNNYSHRGKAMQKLMQFLDQK